MRNVLMISPYRQNDGWGIAAQNYIRSLILTGVNLTLRPIYMGQSICQPPLEFLEFEENVLPYYDIVIQNVLPHLLDYNSTLGKNIALIYTETSQWQNIWIDRLSRMDAIWVPSAADVWNLQGSGLLHPPVHKVPVPLDIGKFLQSHTSPKLNSVISKASCVFYFIGELIQRKNLDKLIQAFHIEFDPSENVELVIKTGKSGVHPDVLAKHLNDYIIKIKSSLRIYGDMDRYKKEFIITDPLSEEELYALHEACSVFVMPSCGESWSLPVMDALGFGNMPIVIDKTGPTDLVNSHNGWIVPSYLDHVLVQDAPLPDLYTAREIWHQFGVYDLAKTMRQAYEYWKTRVTDKQERGQHIVEQLSYSNVATTLKELL